MNWVQTASYTNDGTGGWIMTPTGFINLDHALVVTVRQIGAVPADWVIRVSTTLSSTGSEYRELLGTFSTQEAAMDAANSMLHASSLSDFGAEG
jgi:hypothetical protein